MQRVMPALRISYAIAKITLDQLVTEATAPRTHQRDAGQIPPRTKRVLVRMGVGAVC